LSVETTIRATGGHGKIIVESCTEGDQSPELQKRELKKAGCKKIYKSRSVAAHSLPLDPRFLILSDRIDPFTLLGQAPFYLTLTI
jgi:hypothetical protein